ncbi:hypothetical protein LKO27_14955 [Tessaracoccus sp. OS52]|uniref:hypothetical protein n=1 Tax=Tessaracoccus sp. OS52 TaxID=2886691 RepID=UPI001D0FFA6A|nr:hypothetical protein [Tessaracoccus sp. OS52]MCC2594700.1 hypothetical protein [Tessaracoccus sp. OS52]
MTSQHNEGVARSDIEALGATRKELGSDYEPALLDNFADKVEKAIDARVSAELSRRGQQNAYGVAPGRHGQPPARGGGQQLALGIVSLVSFIPIGIVLGLNGAVFPLLVVMASIVAVNYAHAWLQKPGDQR